MRLAHNKGEGEDKLVIVGQLEEKAGEGARSGRFGVLSATWSATADKGSASGRKQVGRTCTNSTGDGSPRDLATDSLLAGKTLGTTFMEDRLRGLVMSREDMVTSEWRLARSRSRSR